MLKKKASPKNPLRTGYLQASDVFLPRFLKKLNTLGLEVIDPNRIKSDIFQFDEKGQPTQMLVRASTPEAFKRWYGKNMKPGGAGAELWLPLPTPGGEDPASLRKWMTSEYSVNKPKESGQQGRIGLDAETYYGSGWPLEESSIPEAGGTRGPQSGAGLEVTPAMPEDIEPQEDDALDDNIKKDKHNWPSHFNVTIESNFKLYHLCNWLMKNGHEHEAEYLAKIRKVIHVQ